MKYIVTDIGTGPSKPFSKKQKFLINILSAIIPKANPDFEDFYTEVREWWIEIDESNNTPQREIGFNGDGEMIVIGPFGRNHGFWTDSNVTLSWEDYRSIPAREFEESWHLFETENNNSME